VAVAVGGGCPPPFTPEQAAAGTAPEAPMMAFLLDLFCLMARDPLFMSPGGATLADHSLVLEYIKKKTSVVVCIMTF